MTINGIYFTGSIATAQTDKINLQYTDKSKYLQKNSCDNDNLQKKKHIFRVNKI